MLRFYVTGGKVDNERTARVNNTKDETLDDFNVGAMWRRGSKVKAKRCIPSPVGGLGRSTGPTTMLCC